MNTAVNNWYARSMPTIADVTPHIQTIAQTIRAIKGVQAVYVTGSFVSKADQPLYPLKDIDLIASTDFDSGDLMAIDAGSDSPLKMAATELEDYGFNPLAVAFTKRFIGVKDYNIDHWVTSSDKKVLHWGPMPESKEEWQEVHDDAETYAASVTGYNRLKLARQDETTRKQWYDAFQHSIAKVVGRKRVMGWYPSDHSAEETLALAKLL